MIFWQWSMKHYIQDYLCHKAYAFDATFHLREVYREDYEKF